MVMAASEHLLEPVPPAPDETDIKLDGEDSMSD
jgi:hypothetical protein